jgi:hypothetical protein
LPRLLADTPGPKHLPFVISDDDANIRPVTIRINQNLSNSSKIL